MSHISMKSLKKHITKYKSQLWRHNNFPQFLKVINIQISASFFYFFLMKSPVISILLKLFIILSHL